LAGNPEVVKDKDVKLSFPPGADISVTCNEPLCAFILTVPLRVSSPPCLSTGHSYPYVTAADPSSLILLCTMESDARTGRARGGRLRRVARRGEVGD